MSSLFWLIVIFFILCFLVLLVYVLVVRAYYWGDKKVPPVKSRESSVGKQKIKVKS